MHGQSNKVIQQKKTQRKLRRVMTDAELRLWRHLCGRHVSGFKFRRQHPFDNYILDFVCLEAMLIIEIDGGQHASNKSTDDVRTKHLNDAGFRVLRFWNNDVLNNIEGVTETIRLALNDAVG